MCQEIRISASINARPIFASFMLSVYGHDHFVRSFQSVGNEHLAAGGIRGKAVPVSIVQMIQSIFP